MKTWASFLLIMVFGWSSPAQTIKVSPDTSNTPNPAEYRHGLFYLNVNNAGHTAFNSIGGDYNCIRTGEINWLVKNSDSLADALNRVATVKNWHQDMAQSTDRLIIIINTMPQWLSSSSDTSLAAPGDVIKEYETHPPADYAVWDSLIRGIIYQTKSWGLHPYIEVWNEPDLHFWNGSGDELLELYRHTAEAVKEVDPEAKVGGLGMNFWPRADSTGNIPNGFGYIPDSIVDQVSLVGRLIDSTARWNVPLDFLSWHYFTIHTRDISRTSAYFENRLQQAGYNSDSIEKIITEWNLGSSRREQPVQRPLMLKINEKMRQTGIDGNCISNFQDFTYDPGKEFHGGWGMLSRGGLIKPAYDALLLLDYLRMNGQMLQITSFDHLPAFASKSGDTLRVLVGNYVETPYAAAYRNLLYQHKLNAADLYNAGYTSSGKFDSTLVGLLAPTGPPQVVTAFNEATTIYDSMLTLRQTRRQLKLVVPGNDSISEGRRILVDSTHNNIIYRYDSLIAAGYSRTQAINILFPDQDLQKQSVQLQDSVFTFLLQPNAVVLYEFYDVNLTYASGVASGEGKSQPFMKVFPNPFKKAVRINYTLEQPGVVRLSMYDMQGQRLQNLAEGHRSAGTYQVQFTAGQHLTPGIYLVRLTTPAGQVAEKVLLID